MNHNNITQAGQWLRAPTQWQANAAQRILVVEDDLSVRKAYAKVLIGSGYEVDSAEDGVAG